MLFITNKYKYIIINYALIIHKTIYILNFILIHIDCSSKSVFKLYRI